MVGSSDELVRAGVNVLFATFVQRPVPPRLAAIFLTDPNGVTIKLNFCQKATAAQTAQ
jgi:hypothetical protein